LRKNNKYSTCYAILYYSNIKEKINQEVGFVDFFGCNMVILNKEKKGGFYVLEI
jgi:hypothetical protein